MSSFSLDPENPSSSASGMSGLVKALETGLLCDNLLSLRASGVPCFFFLGIVDYKRLHINKEIEGVKNDVDEVFVELNAKEAMLTGFSISELTQKGLPFGTPWALSIPTKAIILERNLEQTLACIIDTE